MSFDALESSIADGKPLRLYLFEHGSRQWRYTSAGQDVVADQVNWQSVHIKDDGNRQTGEASADAMNIDVPLTLPVLDMFRIYPSSRRVSLTVFNLHQGDGDLRATWVGTVSDVKRRRVDARLVCNSIAEELASTGLKLPWTRNCPHTIYDHNCKLKPGDFRVLITVASMDGISLTAAELATKPDGWFSGGYLEWESEDGVIEERGIDIHVGNQVTLMGSTFGITVGQVLKAHAGCECTKQACLDKGNYDNYGGAPGLPGQSPFDGQPIF